MLENKLNNVDESVKIALKTILLKDLTELTEYDIAFLKARKEYLNSAELKFYENLMTGKKEKKEKEATVDYGPIGSDDIGYRELQSKASSLGMEKVVGASRKALEEFIDNKLSTQ